MTRRTPCPGPHRDGCGLALLGAHLFCHIGRQATDKQQFAGQVLAEHDKENLRRGKQYDRHDSTRHLPSEYLGPTRIADLDEVVDQET